MDDQDTGIWALWYDLAEETRDAYCDWFHHVHIPEKLARPGYRWAAHYRLGHGERGQGWLALFGGASAHTFLAPPPSELATRQSDLTRKHMAMRRPLGSAIFAQEVRVDGPEARYRDPRASAPVVQFGHYDAPNAATDEAIGSFYAQQRFPLLARLPGVVATRKLLASVGGWRHGVMYEFTSLAEREHHYEPLEAEARDPSTRMGQVVPRLRHAPFSPAVGVRAWPPAI